MTSNEQWVIGIHAVKELLNGHVDRVIRLLVQKNRSDKRLEELVELATSLGINLEKADKNILDRQTGGSHQGVAALCKVPGNGHNEKFLYSLLDQLNHEPLLLVLDEITDPHNLGACLRTADAAGVDAVIITRNRSASLNMTVRKVASGAAETIDLITVTNLNRTLKQLKERGIWIIGTTEDAANTIHQQDMKGALALVMGSEGKGLRRLTREECDYLVSIPMMGDLSSLNVSVATGVCLYEALRQRSETV